VPQHAHSLARKGEDWTARALTAGDGLPLPEIGIEIPFEELYDGVALPAEEAGDEVAPDRGEN
jgi:hypothetical protein